MITRIEVSTPDIENTYLDIDPETKHGFLIDPGAAPDQIADAIRSGGFTIEKILLTHGHFDHIGAIDAIREAFGHPPVYIHEAGLRYLSSTFFNLSGPMGRPFTVEGAIQALPCKALRRKSPLHGGGRDPVSGRGCVFAAVESRVFAPRDPCAGTLRGQHAPLFGIGRLRVFG